MLPGVQCFQFFYMPSLAVKTHNISSVLRLHCVECMPINFANRHILLPKQESLSTKSSSN